MPYRIDISNPPDGTFDRLVDLGALDIEVLDGSIAAIVSDTWTSSVLARTLGADVVVSPAIGRDDDSVWLLGPRPACIGGIRIIPSEIVPSEMDATQDTLRCTASDAFGSGHHPTTILCGEAIAEALAHAMPFSLLDVGTGSGVLALAALKLGVAQAVGIDINAAALEIAAQHARINGLAGRFTLMFGGPEALDGGWPLVVANIQAAPLIEMAPSLVRRVGHDGRLILSGISAGLESEVRQAYEWLGMRHLRSETRAGWAVVVVQASW